MNKNICLVIKSVICNPKFTIHTHCTSTTCASFDGKKIKKICMNISIKISVSFKNEDNSNLITQAHCLFIYHDPSPGQLMLAEKLVHRIKNNSIHSLF